MKGHSDYLTSVCISPDGTRVVTGSYDSSIKIWQINPYNNPNNSISKPFVTLLLDITKSRNLMADDLILDNCLPKIKKSLHRENAPQSKKNLKILKLKNKYK